MPGIELPLELEERIFELCALMHPASIPQLMLVAHHAKRRAEPILYRTVTLGYHKSGLPLENVIQAIYSRRFPASFFAKHVRRIYLYTAVNPSLSRADLEELIRVCSGPVDLFLIIRGDTALVSLLAGLHITRLTVTFDSIGALPFSHRLFKRLTHLTIVDKRMSAYYWSHVAQIPHLTHLALAGDDLLEICPQLLLTCRKLLVLLIFCERELPAPLDATLASDPRFSVIPRKYAPIADWEAEIPFPVPEIQTVGASRRNSSPTYPNFFWPTYVEGRPF
ncbi:hypothetical protein B0H14DRAFT_2704129, partial [Mycena olivaceomarginata]